MNPRISPLLVAVVLFVDAVSAFTTPAFVGRPRSAFLLSERVHAELEDEDFYRDEYEETPTVELEPVGMSKNSGNRFVAVVWDRELDTKGRDALDLHYDRIELTEDHVMFCRKANLYNETFNTESMVDVLWSLPM